jgi:hypothetical protein
MNIRRWAAVMLSTITIIPFYSPASARSDASEVENNPVTFIPKNAEKKLIFRKMR